MRRILPVLLFACCLATTPVIGGNVERDSTGIRTAFAQGTFRGSLRSFYMQTINHGSLRDYYALGAAAALRYETGSFHGIRLVVGGSYAFNLWSNDLTQPDAVTKTASRYELGLFDLTNPRAKTDLARLEELNIRYQHRTFSAVWGMQPVQTPFLNAQDGRLRPNFVDGLWLRIGKPDRIQAEAAWLYRMAPRSTTQWYTTGRSFGLYPSGLSVYGRPSAYKNQVRTDGLLLASLRGKVRTHTRWSLWDYFVPGVFHTLLGQVDYKTQREKNMDYGAAIQVTRQDALGHGGNPDSSKTYIAPGSGTWVFSGKAGMLRTEWQVWIHYTRISAQGRFLMPREWGRDPFFTFLPRERNEGAGDVHAAMIQLNYGREKSANRLSLAGGYYSMPPVGDAALNKYGMPSYFQFNGEFRRSFQGDLEGLEMQALIVYKMNQGALMGTETYRFNKTDMSNLNLVFTYSF